MISRNYRLLLFLLGLVVFINIYYELNLFIYNPSTNNPEELPLIYKLMGLAPYTNDEFVQVTTSHFTQVTPYIIFISSIASLFKLNDLLVLFFILHAASLTLFYISIRSILKQITYIGEIIITISIISLMLFLEVIYVIPNQRNLFYDFLDPEFITFPFLFFSISFYIAKKYILSYVSLFIATVLHPLYTIPILFGFIIDLIIKFSIREYTLNKMFSYILFYSLCVIPYSFFLWVQGHQTIVSNIDASMIVEIIRAPHHYKIPTVFYCDQTTIIFFVFSIILSLISFISMQKQCLSLNYKEQFIKLFTINIILLSLLIIISGISSFFRIPLLIRLTPYRIGIVIVVLTWLLFISSLINKINLKEQILNKYDLIIFVICIISFVFIAYFRPNYQSEESISNKDKDDFINWIKNNTKNNELFLNYTDIDIRTTVMRSDYFRFQTIPLLADSELSWYKKYQIYFDVPEIFNEIDYLKVRGYAESKHTIDISKVIKRSNAPIKYVLISKNKKPFSRIEEWVNLRNANYFYDLKGLTMVFKNKEYEIYSTI